MDPVIAGSPSPAVVASLRRSRSDGPAASGSRDTCSLRGMCGQQRAGAAHNPCRGGSGQPEAVDPGGQRGESSVTVADGVAPAQPDSDDLCAAVARMRPSPSSLRSHPCAHPTLLSLLAGLIRPGGTARSAMVRPGKFSASIIRRFSGKISGALGRSRGLRAAVITDCREWGGKQLISAVRRKRGGIQSGSTVESDVLWRNLTADGGRMADLPSMPT